MKSATTYEGIKFVFRDMPIVCPVFTIIGINLFMISAWSLLAMAGLR